MRGGGGKEKEEEARGKGPWRSRSAGTARRLIRAEARGIPPAAWPETTAPWGLVPWTHPAMLEEATAGFVERRGGGGAGGASRTRGRGSRELGSRRWWRCEGDGSRAPGGAGGSEREEGIGLG